MGHSPQLPQKARAALGLPLRGPLPRSVRYRGQVEQAERALIGALPKAVAVVESLLDDPDPRTRMVAAAYLIDRGMGKAVSSTKPPAAEDDESPPLAEGNVREISKSLFQGVSDSTLKTIQGLLVADLREKGRIVEGHPEARTTTS